VTEVDFPLMSGKDPDAEGVVATWFVEDGEQVREDQLLADVAVDKVSIEVAAPAAGTVHLLVTAEVPVRQGTPIARID